jgi:flagellar basal-body rod modification protein FlgD
MAAAAGIWNQAPGQALTGPAPMDTASGGSGGTDGTTSSATISANDFLTLLVTEMQNQDPTADTDPNEYINQLVQVNSLEQLIDINQNLTTALGGSGSGSGTGGVAPVPGGTSPAAQGSAAQPTGGTAQRQTAISAAQKAVTALAGQERTTPPRAASGRSPGNLGIPVADPAAQRVAQSLSGQGRRGPTSSALRVP